MKKATSPIKLWYFIIAAIGIALLVIAWIALQENQAQSGMSAQTNANETTDTTTVQDNNIPDETTSTEASQNNNVPSETINTETSQNNNTGTDDDYYGFIESRPSDTAGTWVVSGRSFTATDSTSLNPDDGPLTVGRCVSVDYEGDQARDIESEPDSDCPSTQAPANDPPTSDTTTSDAAPPSTSDDDYYGFIESRPSDTAGTWVVSGRSFTATDSTSLDPDDGPLTVGRCVSVDYEGDQAREIESEPDSDC